MAAHEPIKYGHDANRNDATAGRTANGGVHSDAVQQALIGYFCGDWMPANEMALPLNDAGFVQGVTAVERLRTYSGQLKFADRHLQRWQQTTAALLIDGLPTSGDLLELLHEILERNQAEIANLGDVGITIVATPGAIRRATTRSPQPSPTLAIQVNAIDHSRVERFRTTGQPLVITKVVQPPNESWSRQIKVRSRIHYYLADQAARVVASDALGVLIDSDSSVTETSTCNLAIVKDNIIISPPADRVLSGITQSVIAEIAKAEQIDWIHQPISPDELRAADEVLMMGTTTGLWFANAVDSVDFSEKPRPVYSRLLKAFDLRL